MSRQVIWPYPLLDASGITFEPWEWSIPGGEWADTAIRLKGWDHRTGFALRSSTLCSSEALSQRGVLNDEEVLWLVTLVDCPETQSRHKLVQRISLDEPLLQELNVAAGLVKGRVTIERHVVAGTYQAPSGRRLLPAPHITHAELEVPENLFPTEAFSFKNTGGLPDVEWVVRLDKVASDLWSSPFREAVELWVNTDRTPVADALMRTDNPLHSFFVRLVERDVVRNIFDEVVRELPLIESLKDPDPGSVGAAMANLSAGRLKMDVSDFLAILEGDPNQAALILNESFPIDMLNPVKGRGA